MLRSVLISMSLGLGGLGLIAPAAQARYIQYDKGLSVSRDAKGRYCIRATDDQVATRFGTRIYRRQCQTEQRWSRDGVRFNRRDGRPMSDADAA